MSDIKKSSSEFLADEVKKGYKITVWFFSIIAILAGLFVILFILPTLNY